MQYSNCVQVSVSVSMYTSESRTNSVTVFEEPVSSQPLVLQLGSKHKPFRASLWVFFSLDSFFAVGMMDCLLGSSDLDGN